MFKTEKYNCNSQWDTAKKKKKVIIIIIIIQIAMHFTQTLGYIWCLKEFVIINITALNVKRING